MMMQRDNPMRMGESLDGCRQFAGLLDRDHAERIGEGEMRFRVGVEDSDAELARRGRRQDQGKLIVPELAEPDGKPQTAGIGKCGDPLPMRSQRLRQRALERAGIRVDHAHAMSLNGGDRR